MPALGDDPPPILLVRGGDPVVLAQAVRSAIGELVGDRDRTMALTEFSGDDVDLGAVAAAASTPPFLDDRRVVVVWGASRLLGRDPSAPGEPDDDTEPGVESSGADGPQEGDGLGPGGSAPLLEYLAAPLGTTVLVLEWPSGRVPKALGDAMKRVGGRTVDTSPPRPKDRDGWFRSQLGPGDVRLDAAARSAVLAHLGEDLGRLEPLLEGLRSTYGPGASLVADDVAPFLGGAGDVLPWDLTDAIDAGDRTAALALLERMLAAGRHPLQILAVLVGHHRRMLRLDGVATSERELASFPEKKAYRQLRRIGRDGIARAVQLLARADVDLRGGTGWPDDVSGSLVLEVLVARLSRLAAERGRARS